MSGDPFLGLKTIRCVGCAYTKERAIIYGGLVGEWVWPTVTQPMSKCCPSTTSGTFSLTNIQEEV